MSEGKKRGPKRTVQQRELDLTEMTNLIRKGWTKHRIAEKLGVCHQQVSYDWKEVMRRLVKSREKDATAIKARQLEQLGHIREEALAAWEKSKEPGQKVAVEEVELPDGVRVKTTTTTEGRLPENPYLTTALKALESERDLEGLNAPKKIDMRQAVVTWDVLAGAIPEGPLPDTIEEALRKELEGGGADGGTIGGNGQAHEGNGQANGYHPPGGNNGEGEGGESQPEDQP